MPSKERVARYSAAGRCTRCGGERDLETTTCSSCKSELREIRRRRRRAVTEGGEFCQRCLKSRDSWMVNCSACAASSAARAVATYDAKIAVRREEGRCVRCGYDMHPQMDDGYIVCISCREKYTRPQIRRSECR